MHRYLTELLRGRDRRDLSLVDIASMRPERAECAIRARVQTVYLGRQRALTRILGRQKLYVSTDDVGFAGNIMLDGYWEIWLTQFFARRVRPGMTVIDVGANFGYYTLLFGAAVGSAGRVIAVEPNPAAVDLLARSIHLNGYAPHTRLEAVALGREPSGEVLLYVPDGEPKNAAVVQDERPETVIVKTTTLDALATDLDRVDLVKIDAEGAEFDIMAGMQETLARHRPDVVLEFCAARYGDAPAFLADLRRQFRSVRCLDVYGHLSSVDERDILERYPREDRLLFLEFLGGNL